MSCRLIERDIGITYCYFSLQNHHNYLSSSFQALPPQPFTFMTQLQRRSKVSEDKPYRCCVDQCGKGFYQKCTLLRHQRSKHPYYWAHRKQEEADASSSYSSPSLPSPPLHHPLWLTKAPAVYRTTSSLLIIQCLPPAVAPSWMQTNPSCALSLDVVKLSIRRDPWKDIWWRNIH